LNFGDKFRGQLESAANFQGMGCGRDDEKYKKVKIIKNI
jgi:hypothetical protein